MIFVVVAIPKTTSLFWFRVVTATKLKTKSTYVIWFWFLVSNHKLMQQKKSPNSNLEACLKILGLPGFKTKIKVLTIDLKALRSKIYFCWKTDVSTRGLFICYPIFKVHFFVFMEDFWKILSYIWLVFQSGLQSRAGYDDSC